MKTKRFALTFSLLIVPVVALLSILPPASAPIAVAQSPASTPETAATPVEDDMHEFMEYFFEPTYKRLKVSMAASDKDKGTWKSIKSDSLILAESGNLLLSRGPESDAKDWNKHATTVRDFGGKLYRAAKKKDDTESQKVYRLMLQSCNDCHQQFADGKHQLKP